MVGPKGQASGLAEAVVEGRLMMAGTRNGRVMARARTGARYDLVMGKAKDCLMMRRLGGCQVVEKVKNRPVGMESHRDREMRREMGSVIQSESPLIDLPVRRPLDLEEAQAASSISSPATSKKVRAG